MAVLCNSSSLRMSGYGLSFILCMCLVSLLWTHYNDVIMGAMASQITSLAIVYSTVYSGGDQRKHQSSASLDFVRGIHRWQMANNAENVSIWCRHNVIILWQGALPSVDYIRSWHNLDVFLIKRYRGVCFLFRCWNDFLNIANMAFVLFDMVLKCVPKFMLWPTRNTLCFSLSIIWIFTMDEGISMYCGMSHINLTYIPSMPGYVSSS